MKRTLTNILLPTPNSIVLASSHLRPGSYVALITRELTDCIIIHLFPEHRILDP